MSAPLHRTARVPGLTPGAAAPVMDLVCVGGSLDEVRVRFPARHRYVDVEPSGAAVLVFAALSGHRFQPLRVQEGGGHAGLALVPPAPGAVAEVYVFSGFRTGRGRLRRRHRQAVYVHVDTRPLRVTTAGAQQHVRVV